MRLAIITILLATATVQLSWGQQTGGNTDTVPTNTTHIVMPVPNAESQLSPEKLELRSIILEIISKELEMTDEQVEQFAPTYFEYRHNIRIGQVKVSEPADIETASDAEINSLLSANLENYIHIAMVRKVYVPIFEKFLSPKQVYKLYSIDNSLAKRARTELQKRNRKAR